MSQNQTTRYFKYAIGEIILVVIGILIALQINNWNQGRISAKKERSYLNEIRTSLKSDALKISEALEFNVGKDSIVVNLMGIFDSSLSNDERMEIIEANSLPFTSYEYFTPSSTTWNNFISAENINLISNQDLRTKLMAYYSFNYEGSVQERIKDMNRKVIDENFPKFFTKEYTSKYLNIDTDFPTNAEFTMHRSQQFISDLYGIRFLINAQNEFFKTTNDQVTAMIALIEDEMQL